MFPEKFPQQRTMNGTFIQPQSQQQPKNRYNEKKCKVKEFCVSLFCYFPTMHIWHTFLKNVEMVHFLSD